jgi:hypothetical protein
LATFKRYRLLLAQRDFDPSHLVQFARADADLSKIWP